MILTKLLLLFTLIPLLEIYLLVKIGSAIGAIATVALVAGTGLAGALLARKEGFVIWLRIQYEMQQGRFPARDLLDGLLLLVAGVTLITPGVITDLIGFLILVPVTRIPIRQWLQGKLDRMMRSGSVGLRGFFR
jgi:UPF0716 protein FxsA